MNKNNPQDNKSKTSILKISIKGIFLVACFHCVQSKAACWDDAAAMYGHDPFLLKAIAWKESKGHVKAVGSPLKDGNVALGLMQINTIHLPALRKTGITRADLFDPCTSQKVGAWVLADCLKKFGEIWRSVGCYYGGAYSKAYTAMKLYSLDVRKFYEGYKRKANLTPHYEPLYGFKPQEQLPSPKSQNPIYTEEMAYQSQVEKPSSIKIISFDQ